MWNRGRSNNFPFLYHGHLHSIPIEATYDSVCFSNDLAYRTFQKGTITIYENREHLVNLLKVWEHTYNSLWVVFNFYFNLKKLICFVFLALKLRILIEHYKLNIKKYLSLACIKLNLEEKEPPKSSKRKHQCNF